MPKIIETTKTGPQLHNWNNHNRNNDLVGFSFWDGYAYIEPFKFNLAHDSTYWRRWFYKIEWMKRDPTVALLRQMAIAGIEAAGWSVEFEEDTPDEVVDFANREVKRIHSMVIRQAGLGCYDYGWAPFERIFETNEDGLICVKKLKSLMQSMTLIETDEDTGAFEGVSQDSIVLNLEECLLFNFDVEGTNWYGRAPMLACEKPFDSSVQINSSRHKQNRRIAASHWIVYYPIGRTPTSDPSIDKDDEGKGDNFAIANRIMEKLLEDGHVALPNEIRSELNVLNGDSSADEFQSWRVELLGGDSAGSAQFYTDQLRYEDSLKARAFGFPERALLEGQFGTKAEAEQHAESAIQILEQRNEELAKPPNELLGDLLAWNFGEEQRKAARVVANPLMDQQRIWFGKIWDKFTENPDILLEQFEITDMAQLREKLKIPTVEEGEQSGNLEAVGEAVSTLQDAKPDMPEMVPGQKPSEEPTEEEEEEPAELSEFVFGCGANTGSGGVGFGPGNDCAKGSGAAVIDKPDKKEGYHSAKVKVKNDREIEIVDRGLGTYVVRTPEGEEIGRADLDAFRTRDFLTNVRVHKSHQRQGIATALYDYIEHRLGKKLRPSPDSITDEGKAFRKSRK